MAEHARYSKVSITLIDAHCAEKGCSCTIKNGLWYADNDVMYCYDHVISHIDIWRLVKCTHCDCPDLQGGTICKKCGKPL